MKKLFFLFSCFTSLVFGQSKDGACATLSKINAKLQAEHYKPKPLNDSLSVFVFSEFLEKLDDNHQLFLQSEIDNLSKYKYNIDDAIKNSDCLFLEDFYKSYQMAVKRYSNLISEINKESIPKSSNEKVSFTKKALPYFKTESALKNFLKRKIIFSSLKDITEVSTNKDSLVQNLDTLFETSKNQNLETYLCKSSNLTLTQQEFNSLFYNLFCNYFDPHTAYFSQQDKSSFLSFVSADNLTFGLYVNVDEKDQIFVTQIIPGSSAYFSEAISVGDQIIKIKVNKILYNVTCSSISKIHEIMTSDNYKNAEVTFLKKTGEIFTVSLEKKIMKDYANNVYSYIISKDNLKFGYIKIPSFYAVFENGNTNVSADVAKEIYKLKKDKIDGLIIDLQNNGGGSLQEAVKLCGMFIDVGPVAVMDKRNEKNEILKDGIRGTVYTDNIVVLINGFSASASEFFANAMQDYNRGLLLGTSSFGKASMQQILPLEEKENTDEFLKITLQQFYRITGKSNQYIGVQPDIEIPILFDKQMPRESEEKAALKNSILDINVRFEALEIPNKKMVIATSLNRLKNNKSAEKIKELNKQYSELADGDIPDITLNFEAVYNQVNKANVLWKAVADFSKEEFNVEVNSNTTDLEFEKFNDFLKSNSEEKKKDIKTNLSIFEAVNCLIDLKNK